MKIAILLLALSGILRAETWSYWIQPCSADVAVESQCVKEDAELGRWALEAWGHASDGSLTLVPAVSEVKARLRLYWASGRAQLYGETRPLLVDGKRGAEVFVLPSIAAGGDGLLRDAVVYLTCLHESGHAFGLPHTSAFEDIMYSFQYGGDIAGYFNRYRRTIAKREDIRRSSGLSPNDRTALAHSLR